MKERRDIGKEGRRKVGQCKEGERRDKGKEGRRKEGQG